MGVILTENFSSPSSLPTTTIRRWGGDNLSTAGRWFVAIVPYVEVLRANEPVRVSVQDVQTYTGGQSLNVKRIFFDNPGDPGTFNVCFKQSTNVTLGACVQFMMDHFSYWNSGTPACYLQFSFRSMLENSATEKENFRIRIDLDPITMQKATITFTTVGTGYPAIAPITIYRDFSNKPVWFWAQCDMYDASNQKGIARVWIGDDLMVTRENIYTGDVNSWGAQPWYAKNNRCVVTFQNYLYSASYPRNVYVYGFAATNEDQSYLTTALGDVALSVVPPQALSSLNQWETALDGVETDSDNAAVLRANRFVDIATADTLEYVHTAEHLSRDLHAHDNPFYDDTHVIAATQRLAHKKTVPPGDTSKYRIEPAIQASGQDPIMDRTKGQICLSNLRVQFVPYNVPYAGAFWTWEILSMCKFGYTLFDYARPEFVAEDMAVLGEYDVENVDSDLGMADEATAGDTP